ncbi:MAG: universal stress protein [Desulfuromonadales bacterium]|nr:universal stress protein [Desulfuromonadales bacterium]
MLPKIKKILYATAMGASAPYVFRYALMSAKHYDAQIVAVAALEKLSPFASSLVELHISQSQSKEIHEKAQAQAKERLQERIQRLCTAECGTDPHSAERLDGIIVKEGPAAQVILSVAKEQKVDLIIMGSHRHSALQDAVLGSTTSKVLHSATIPVLVVRIPDGYHEEGY